MEELISIVVPIYKVENYIDKCIESIINQTYKNVEILLIDDGSPDNCPKICENYSKKDSRIKVYHKENGGLSDARNYGIERSKGKYICFIDSDDFVHEKFIEILYKNIKKYNADISICHHYKFKDYSETNNYLPKEETEVYTGLEMLNNLYDNYLNNIVAWNKLYKRKLFDKIRYPKGKKLEDAYIIHKLYNNSKKVVITNLELYYYIQRDNSIMGTLNTSALVEQDLLIERIRYLEENKLKNEPVYENTIKKFIDRLYDNYYYLNIHGNINPNLYNKYFKFIKKYSKKVKLNKKTKLMLEHRYIYLVLRTMNKIKDKSIDKYINIKRIIVSPIYDLKYLIYRIGNKEKNIILNCPNHYNLGDHAILLAENKILNDLGKKTFNVYSHYTEHFLKKYAKTINKNDNIYITGGGNTGTLWTNEQDRINLITNKFCNNKIVIFPQTIYYSDDIYGKYRLSLDNKNYKKCKNLLIMCRDKKSYEFCKENITKNCLYTPDIVTTLKYDKLNNNYKKQILYCFRKDKEKTGDSADKIIKYIKSKYDVVEFTTVYDNYNYSLTRGRKDLHKLLNKISNSSLVITDRLHAMIFAAITGTSCIALNNKSGKVKGVYEWLHKYNKYIHFAESYDNFIDIIENIKIENHKSKYEFQNKEYIDIIVKGLEK